MAAPGPPVAKLQCTASLAGARPAEFTSVPGRAAVAFGAVDPSPGSWAPVYPWSDGQGLPRQGYLGRRLAAAYRPGKARARRGAWGAWRRLRALLAHALQGQISPHPGGSIFLPGTPFPPGNSPVFPFTNGGFSATMKRSALEPCARAADHSDGVPIRISIAPRGLPGRRNTAPCERKNGGKTHDQERDHRRLCPSRGRHRFP